MPLTRREFLWTAAASAAVLPRHLRAQQPGMGLFRHGVASGDPLADRVILWTRTTPAAGGGTTAPIDVEWTVARDEALTQNVRRGRAQARPENDFTVKVDAGGLEPDRRYYYAFSAGGERSPVG